MSYPPKNRIPVVGDTFHDEWNNRIMKIDEVGDEIRSGVHVGRAIACGNCWYDCVWSDMNQRFQYHHDLLSSID